MVLRVELLQPLARDVRVDRGRRDVGMPEQQLHDAQVRAVVEEVRGEGVAQDVRRDRRRRDACDGAIALDREPERLPR